MIRPPKPPARYPLPRLIATDLDGTLIGTNFAISARSAHALSRAATAGASVVLVTGRSLRRLSPVYAELGAHYPAICANGAVTYDPTKDSIVACRPMQPAQVLEVCLRLRATLPGIVFAAHVDYGRQMLHEAAWPLRDDTETTLTVGLEELASTQVVKLQARAPGRDPGSFTSLVADAVGDLVEATHQGNGGLVEMTQRGVTKANALAAVAAELDIAASDALVFGDMPNDISMFGWAGKAIAVANAHPDVQAAADDITLSNLDDGVAVYLERYLTCLP